ncbi:MAG: hypothetical protein M1816_005314 [Peltula sp. TS41687]|nr:MAG: hypothetical protein M1816_005314 [Peltula sp. TS41687]
MQRHLPATPRPDYLPYDHHSPSPSPSTDFVLFPNVRTTSRRSVELTSATLPEGPDHHRPLREVSHDQHRRNSNSTHSPLVFASRVTGIVRGSPSSSTSSPSISLNRFSPSLAQQRRDFYASSAPTSSSVLRKQQRQPQQQPQQTTTRPPVPLFSSNSTGNVHLQQQKDQLLRIMASTEMSPEELDALFELPTSELGDHLSSDTPLLDSNLPSPQFTPVNEAEVRFPMKPPKTVSPKDLVIRDFEASAPPSAAFTNLTSPSNFGSPEFCESFQTSPVFNNLDGDLPQEPWFPLFPGANSEVEESPLIPTEDSFDSLGQGSRPSSLVALESSPTGRSAPVKHSSISGVSARKRDRPLPPIQVEDPTDTVAMKRARNTLAARKSRQKKVEKFEELEKTIEDLRGEVLHWKNIALARTNGSGC